MPNPNNTNLLSVNKFKVVINKFPHVEFFAQSANLPGFSTGEVRVPNGSDRFFKSIGDKIEFNDLVISFIVDEDLLTIKELLTFAELIMNHSEADSDPYSDITVIALTNNSNANKRVTYRACSLSSMSDINWDTRIDENNPPVVQVSIKHQGYTIE
jgi:hypothetical protein